MYAECTSICACIHREQAFDECQRICNDRFQNAFWEPQKLFGLADERIAAHCSRTIREFGLATIRAKRDNSSMGAKLGPDLISRFIESTPDITDDELIDIVNNFIIAGRDTTAAALTWTMYELMQSSAAMDAVRAEIAEKLPAPIEAMDQKASFDLLYNGLPYVKATLSEGLRLHPSVPKNIKFSVKKVLLIMPS